MHAFLHSKRTHYCRTSFQHLAFLENFQASVSDVEVQNHLPDLQNGRRELAGPFLSSTPPATPVKLYRRRFPWH